MKINERVSDATIDGILSGVIEGVEPTTHEIAMARELKELRNNNKSLRGELLIAHRTLMNQLAHLQQYRAAAEPVAYDQAQRDHMKDILIHKLSSNLTSAAPLVMADIHACTMALMQAGFRAAPQVTNVPDESEIFDAAIDICRKSDAIDEHAWNRGVLAVMSAFRACRAAMLAAPAVQAEQLSGNTEQVSQPDAIDANLVEALRLVQCMLEDYRERNHGDAERWIRHINDLMSDYSEAHGDDAYSVLHGLLPAAPKQDFREIPNSSTNNCRENADSSTKCWCHTCRPVTMTDMRFVVCPECGNKRCPHANDHRNACTGSNAPGQEGSAYPDAPKQEAE